jgi:hypothetical protein
MRPHCSTIRTQLVAAVFSVASAFSTPVAAQVPNPPAPRLLNATSIRCAFTVMATGAWTADGPAVNSKPVKLSVAFTAINTEDGTADAVDDTRKAHITVRVVGNYINFMQVDAYGAVYVTTVFNTAAKNGRLLAVHTRHEYTPVQLPGLTSRPEQYYGDCDVK